MTHARSQGALAYTAHSTAQHAKAQSADEYFMAVALSLARYGQPAPNPAVGAVIVRHGKIVGAGYHERAGEAHAEVMALKRAGALAIGATLYVTLEPCNHFGRTPPCVDAVAYSGVSRVVFGCADPNSFVCGGGAARLRALGVEVTANVLASQATQLIAPWLRTLRRETKSWRPVTREFLP